MIVFRKHFLSFNLLKLILILSFVIPYLSVNSQDVKKNDAYTQLDSLLVNQKYNKVIELAEALKKNAKDLELLDIDLKLANAYVGLEQSDEAVAIILNNLKTIEERKIHDYYIRYTDFLAKMYEKDKNYETSLEYLNKKLNKSIKLKDSLEVVGAYLDIGRVYYRQKNSDTAKYFFSKIIDYPASKPNLDIKAKAFNNLAVIALDNKDLKLAEEYNGKSLSLKREKGDTLGIVIALINLSAIHYKKEQYKTSEQLYLEAHNLIKNDSSTVGKEISNEILYNLAYVNEKLNNYKIAYGYLDKAIDLNIELDEAAREQSITEIKARYDVIENDNKLQEKIDDEQRAQVLFYSAAFALISFLVLGYIFYRNYRLKQENKFEHIENETQTKIINATVDAKEQERKAIAETLHDSVSALLSSANLHLQATKAQLKDKAPQEITKAQTILNEASVKIRDLSHELISSILLKFGLAFAVHDMCQKYSNSEITLHSDDDGIKRYHTDFEIKIHNIVEELVNNILKHSKASNATIMLAHRENDMLSVRISDDGVGFNPKEVRGKDGLGLSHIEARIKVMKGVFNIISSKENGTNIFISVPIKFKDND